MFMSPFSGTCWAMRAANPSHPLFNPSHEGEEGWEQAASNAAAGGTDV